MDTIQTDQLVTSAGTALKECLGLGRQERLLIVTDAPCLRVANAFFTVGEESCRETVLVRIVPRAQNGNEPPDPVGEWFGQFDVAVMPTSRSLSHTRARRLACEKGTRVATLPGISEESFARCLDTNWEKLGVETRLIASHLTLAASARITSAAGTDLSFSIAGRRAKSDDGRINHRGAFGNLPAGEAFIAPVEGSAQGRLVIDGSFPLAGLLDQPLVLTIKDGSVSEVSGHPCGDELEKLFRKYGSDARNIAEFGIGTLDTARISGNILEDEKVRGTIHIAVGDNASMGGAVQVAMHHDGIVRSPSVWLDDKKVMHEGTLIEH